MGALAHEDARPIADRFQSPALSSMNLRRLALLPTEVRGPALSPIDFGDAHSCRSTRGGMPSCRPRSGGPLSCGSISESCTLADQLEEACPLADRFQGARSSADRFQSPGLSSMNLRRLAFLPIDFRVPPSCRSISGSCTLADRGQEACPLADRGQAAHSPADRFRRRALLPTDSGAGGAGPEAPKKLFSLSPSPP